MGKYRINDHSVESSFYTDLKEVSFDPFITWNTQTAVLNTAAITFALVGL